MSLGHHHAFQLMLFSLLQRTPGNSSRKIHNEDSIYTYEDARLLGLNVWCNPQTWLTGIAGHYSCCVIMAADRVLRMTLFDPCWLAISITIPATAQPAIYIIDNPSGYARVMLAATEISFRCVYVSYDTKSCGFDAILVMPPDNVILLWPIDFDVSIDLYKSASWQSRKIELLALVPHNPGTRWILLPQNWCLLHLQLEMPSQLNAFRRTRIDCTICCLPFVAAECLRSWMGARCVYTVDRITAKMGWPVVE